MGVSERPSRRRAGTPERPRHLPAWAVVWHDLECGAYAADLPLWRELAAAGSPGPVLEIGGGTGRVTLDLARRGHRVTAVERDGELLDALRERAAAGGLLDVEAVQGDARALALHHRAFSVCLVPMQTVQLFGGREGRGAFLRGARAHLAPGGVLACAIVTDLETFDCSRGEPGPSPESAELEGAAFISRAVRVSVDGGKARIERERRVLPAAGRPSLEHDVVELDLVSVGELQREGRAAGFAPLAAREIPATSAHAGSVAVMFRA